MSKTLFNKFSQILVVARSLLLFTLIVWWDVEACPESRQNIVAIMHCVRNLDCNSIKKWLKVRTLTYHIKIFPDKISEKVPKFDGVCSKINKVI